MKFIIKSIIVMAIVFVISSCDTTGGVWLGEGETNGKPYSFGPKENIEMLSNLAKAYSNKDSEALFKFYSEDFLTEKRKENTIKWAESLETLSMVPYKIIPLKNGNNFNQVIAWSKEERIYKNGSYEKLDLMESFILDEHGKVKGFKQWKAIDSVNFGMSYGGKFFGRKDNENTGRPFVFSNRNETAIMEQFVKDYNDMNVEGMKSVVADEFTFNDYQGKKATLKKSELAGFFKPFRSVDWKLISIVPIKISNTDAASGVIVYSTENRVYKNGRKWNADLMEIFYFDLEGKISSMTQFAK